MKKPFNIIFIVIDALRAKNLGCYGYSKQITPNIDSIAKEGLLFENAFSVTNMTDSSLTSIFSGKYPPSHGIISHGPEVGETSMRYFNESGTQLLPEILKQRGYMTFAIDWLERWHTRGFDYYSGSKIKNSTRKMGRGMLTRFPFLVLFDRFTRTLSRHYANHSKSMITGNATEVTSHAIDLIKKVQKKPFFLFLHYWDSHMPYAPPLRYLSTKRISNLINPIFLNPLKLYQVLRHSSHTYAPHYCSPTNEITQEFIQRYNASISFLDDEIGKIVNFLEKMHLTEDTLLILTSDHGESLVEHKIYFDHHGLYDVSIHVPLIMNYKGFPRGKRIKDLVSHIDLTPTLLEMLAEETEKYNMNGKSLLPLIFGKQGKHHEAIYAIEEFAQRRCAIRTKDYKYIFAPSEKKTICRYCRCIHSGHEELYDLRKDPNEIKNISNPNPDIINELKDKLVKWLESFGYFKKFVKKRQDTVSDTNEEILTKLRALGYV